MHGKQKIEERDLNELDLTLWESSKIHGWCTALCISRANLNSRFAILEETPPRREGWPAGANGKHLCTDAEASFIKRRRHTRVFAGLGAHQN